MINISNALLIVRPMVKVYCNAHGMFASALVTRNVNRILRHRNSFRSLFTTVGECQLKCGHEWVPRTDDVRQSPPLQERLLERAKETVTEA
jgi:hypothetical protein